MYGLSRAIYRAIEPEILAGRTCEETRDTRERVLRACEATVERLVTDRHYFARPAKTLFGDVRRYFPISAQPHVYRVIERYLTTTRQVLENRPQRGFDINGNRLQCRAMTRKGTPCQRVPLPHNGYCPSHQHLAETELPQAQAA